MKTLSDKEFGNDERYGELLMDKTAFWREDIVEFILPNTPLLAAGMKL